MVECLMTWKGPHRLIGAHPAVLGDIFGMFWVIAKKWPQHMPPLRNHLVKKGPFQLHRTCQNEHGRMSDHLEGAPLPYWRPFASSRGYSWNLFGNFIKVAFLPWWNVLVQLESLRSTLKWPHWHSWRIYMSVRSSECLSTGMCLLFNIVVRKFAHSGKARNVPIPWWHSWFTTESRYLLVLRQKQNCRALSRSYRRKSVLLTPVGSILPVHPINGSVTSVAVALVQ